MLNGGSAGVFLGMGIDIGLGAPVGFAAGIIPQLSGLLHSTDDQRPEHGSTIGTFFRPAEHPVLSFHRNVKKAALKMISINRYLWVIQVNL